MKNGFQPNKQQKGESTGVLSWERRERETFSRSTKTCPMAHYYNNNKTRYLTHFFNKNYKRA